MNARNKTHCQHSTNIERILSEWEIDQLNNMGKHLQAQMSFQYVGELKQDSKECEACPCYWHFGATDYCLNRNVLEHAKKEGHIEQTCHYEINTIKYCPTAVVGKENCEHASLKADINGFARCCKEYVEE